MKITAVSRNIPIAPRKIRLVAESVRKLRPVEALATLAFIKKRASVVLLKTLENALANAKNKNLKADELHIKMIDVLEGRDLKRFRPSTRGRVHPYKKRTTHIRIILEGTDVGVRLPDKGGKDK